MWRGSFSICQSLRGNLCGLRVMLFRGASPGLEERCLLPPGEQDQRFDGGYRNPVGPLARRWGIHQLGDLPQSGHMGVEIAAKPPRHQLGSVGADWVVPDAERGDPQVRLQ